MALTTKQRKQRLKACWEDMLFLAEGLIAQAKAGEVKLGAPLLREISALLQGLQARVDEEESTVRPGDELAAAMASLPDELKVPLRIN